MAPPTTLAVRATIQWVALPFGIQDAGKRIGRFSVFVAPRLNPLDATALTRDLTLADFPAFLDWPRTLRSLDLHVEIAGGKTIRASRVTARGPDGAPDPGREPQSDTWGTFFPSTARVAAFTPRDLANRPLIVPPTADLHALLNKVYAEVGKEHAGDLPENDKLAGTYNAVISSISELDSRLSTALAGDGPTLAERLGATRKTARDAAAAAQVKYTAGVIPTGTAPITAGTDRGPLERAMLFHYRPRPDSPPFTTPALPKAAEVLARADVHQTLSFLGEFPSLLRRCGLVLDYEIDLSDVPYGDAGRMRVIPSFGTALPDSIHYTPWTAFSYGNRAHALLGFPAVKIPVLGKDVTTQVIEPDYFHATPHDVTITRPHAAFGMLDITDPSTFTRVDLDVDGGALKAINMATTLRRFGTRSLDAETRSGLPALRSAGISLVHAGHARLLNDAFNLAHNAEQALAKATKSPTVTGGAVARPAPDDATFHAEDLTRGYRVDIYDDTMWRSLHARQSTVTVPGNAAGIVVADEGFVQPAITEDALPIAGETGPEPLYIHETLFHWDGWSLSAPRPGKSADVPPDKPEMAGIAAQLAVEAGTLPRLRFGTPYRVRVRAIDLAGNGPTLKKANEQLNALETGNPIAALEALLDAIKLIPGISIPNVDLAAKVRAETQSFALRPDPYRRYEPVVPPTLIPRAPYGLGESLRRLVIRSSDARPWDERDLPMTNERHLLPPATTVPMIEAHGRFPASLTDRYKLAETATGSVASLFPAATAPEPGSPDPTALADLPASLPYVPDPVATGMLFANLPNVPPAKFLDLGVTPLKVVWQLLQSLTLTRLPYEGPWPDYRPARLRLVAGSNAPAWDPATRCLTVALRPAEVRTVRISSWGESLLPLQDALLNEAVTAIANLVKIGAAASEIVAAIQKYLVKDPALMALWYWLCIAYPQEALLAFLQHGQHWMVTPYQEITLAHVVQQPLVTPASSVTPATEKTFWHRDPGSTLVHIRDTVRLDIRSTDKLDLSATWSEPRDIPNEGPPDTINGAAHVFEYLLGPPNESSGPPDAADSFAKFDTNKPDGRKLPAHQFGDTKHRYVTYTYTATSRFRDHFKEGAEVTHAASLQAIHVHSSARPAAPSIRFVVPTFGWTKETSKSERKGNGLRVYLDRPWYSSGNDEVLGVVVKDAGYPGHAFVTQWGRDPITASYKPGSEFPTVSAFPDRRDGYGGDIKRTGLLLAGFEGQYRAAVAPHRVEYDKESDSYYCDIAMRPPSDEAYFPFIRLALARFQPYALDNCELSPVVLAHFAQLAPDRTASVVRDPAAADDVIVTVFGSARRRDPRFKNDGSYIEVFIERYNPDLGASDSDLAWTRLYPAPASHALGESVALAVPNDAQLYRVAIREYESWDTGGHSETRRLVYADTIALPQ